MRIEPVLQFLRVASVHPRSQWEVDYQLARQSFLYLFRDLLPVVDSDESPTLISVKKVIEVLESEELQEQKLAEAFDELARKLIEQGVNREPILEFASLASCFLHRTQG
ncbi:MAG: hypothetical protein NUV84_02815 [Candidatus Uhrbacteria bacterium]|nr:hypothetical protein [Candidatus Uhrbacteria bacterium]